MALADEDPGSDQHDARRSGRVVEEPAQARPRAPRLRRGRDRVRRARQGMGSVALEPRGEPLPLRHPRGEGPAADRVAGAGPRGAHDRPTAPAPDRCVVRGDRLDAGRAGRAPAAVADDGDLLRLPGPAGRDPGSLARERLAALPLEDDDGAGAPRGRVGLLVCGRRPVQGVVQLRGDAFLRVRRLARARPRGEDSDDPALRPRCQERNAARDAPKRRHRRERRRRGDPERLGAPPGDRAARRDRRRGPLPLRSPPLRQATRWLRAGPTARRRRPRSRFRARARRSCSAARRRPPPSAPDEPPALAPKGRECCPLRCTGASSALPREKPQFTPCLDGP